jgi:hypothetical protein
VQAVKQCTMDDDIDVPQAIAQQSDSERQGEQERTKPINIISPETRRNQWVHNDQRDADDQRANDPFDLMALFLGSSTIAKHQGGSGSAQTDEKQSERERKARGDDAAELARQS